MGGQGNMEHNFWEHGNSVKVNFGEHLNFFLRNKGITVNSYREQGNMDPPLGGAQISPPYNRVICNFEICKYTVHCNYILNQFESI